MSKIEVNQIEKTSTGSQIEVLSNMSFASGFNLIGNITGDITGEVTATSTLADGVTATTQSQGDNSTKVATTAYVDTAAANLADIGLIIALG